MSNHDHACPPDCPAVSDEQAEEHQEAVDEAVAAGQMIPLRSDLLEAPDPLTAQQRARATAVWEARMTLETKRGKGPLAPRDETPPSVPDLLVVADYILDGRDEFGGDDDFGV